MTRKKWNRLRRQRPDLFRGPGWESPRWRSWDFMVQARPRVVKYGKAAAIAHLTAFKLTHT